LTLLLAENVLPVFVKGDLSVFLTLSASLFDLSLFHLVLFLAAHTAGSSAVIMWAGVIA